MSKVAIVYWSGTGNTEAMANYVAEGVKKAGGEADLFTSAEFGADKAGEYDRIAFGCPSMGAEQLEESEFQPMFDEVSPVLSGKKIALFGSYGMGRRRVDAYLGERLHDSGRNHGLRAGNLQRNAGRGSRC